MGRFKAWLDRPRKTPTNRAALIGSVIKVLADAVANFARERRHQELSQRIEVLERNAVTQAKINRATAELIGAKFGITLPPQPPADNR